MADRLARRPKLLRRVTGAGNEAKPVRIANPPQKMIYSRH